MQLFQFVVDTILKFGCFFCQNAPPHPTVSTKYGVVEGYGLETSFGFEADVFLGIPFAKPPTGDLRYEKPVAPEPWKTPLSAKQFRSRCVTYPTYDPLESEDCLYLNIIRPTKLSNTGYPVIFWIHGGDFITATVENLLSRGIVFVSTNYRLGPFGFYSTGNDFAPGNYGLWDQLQALNFTREIIADFGGNPDQITILGESAGGASVSWLTLNADSSNLFAHAVSLSGSHQSVWANGDGTVESSKKMNRVLGCDKVEDLKKCLQKASVEDILKAARSFMPPRGLQVDIPDFSYFNPRIDGDFVDAVDFKDAIKRAPKRAGFIGIDSQEDISFAIDRSSTNFSKYLPLPTYKLQNFREDNFTEAVAAVLGTEDAFGSKKGAATKAILDFYGKNTNYRRNFFLQTYVQIFPSNLPKMKADAGHEMYFYRHSFVAEEYKDPMIDGARHGSELMHIFTMPPQNGSESRRIAQKTFVDLIISFAKYGKPVTSDFAVPAAMADKVPFVDISGNPRLGKDLWPDRVAFWDKLAQDYGFDWPSGQIPE
uniref:Carboxylic ester hydrolase n=2 Tax=Panagrolaimus sp. JU765 TaxID=591449 RepID=A0AC34QQE0_9BILA